MSLPGTKAYLISRRPVERLLTQCPDLIIAINEGFAVPRTGLIDRGVPLEICETIGGHSSKLAYDSEIFPVKKYGLNLDEMLEAAAWHDIPVEIPPGRDIGRHEGVSSVVKDKLEREWLDGFLNRFGPNAARVGRVWNNYQTAATMSMEWEKELDKLRGGCVEPVEAKINPEIVREEFFSNTRSLVTRPFLKFVYNRFVGAIQSGSQIGAEEIYHEQLSSHRDFEVQRNALVAVSRRPEAYMLAFGVG